MHSSQSCCSSTTVSYLASTLAQDGVQHLQPCLQGLYMWFPCRKEVYDGRFHHAMVPSEVDTSPRHSAYQQSDVMALLQMSVPRHAAVERAIQHPWRPKDTSTVQEWIKLPTYSGYLDSYPTSEALYHFLMAYAFSTLWTQCNEPYELHACRIEMMSLELLWRCAECIMHRWDHQNTDHDWHSQWSLQCSCNTKQHDSVATLLALHTTPPSHQGSWFLVVGFSSFAWWGLWLEVYPHCDIAL